MLRARAGESDFLIGSNQVSGKAVEFVELGKYTHENFVNQSHIQKKDVITGKGVM